MEPNTLERKNNFGTLRLLFAILVIVSHSPEMIDGNRTRELLTMLFGTLSFGELAVDGFFLISGYLITKSMSERKSLLDFMISRVARIYPGFLVAVGLCVILLAPLVTDQPVFNFEVLGNNFIKALLLINPSVSGAFEGLHYPILNGSLWTVRWEFYCYLGTAALGLSGLLHHRWRYLILGGAAGLFAVLTVDQLHSFSMKTVPLMARFGAVFLTGAIFYLFRDRITYNKMGAINCAAALVSFLFFKPTAEPAFAVFGGYLIFWFAFAVKQLPTSRIDNRADISYGIYLYGWPFGSLIVYYWPHINPWALGALTMACAMVAGLASWFFVERPAMQAAKGWLKDRDQKSRTATATT